MSKDTTENLTNHERLFDFFSKGHDLVLTNGELDDIVVRVFEIYSERLLEEFLKSKLQVFKD